MLLHPPEKQTVREVCSGRALVCLCVLRLDQRPARALSSFFLLRRTKNIKRSRAASITIAAAVHKTVLSPSELKPPSFAKKRLGSGERPRVVEGQLSEVLSLEEISGRGGPAPA